MMHDSCLDFWIAVSVVAVAIFQASNHFHVVRADQPLISDAQTTHVVYTRPNGCQRYLEQWDQGNISSSIHSDKDIEILITYTDRSGAIHVASLRSKKLSASWVWRGPGDSSDHFSRSSMFPDQFSKVADASDEDFLGDDQVRSVTVPSQLHPIKAKRQMLRRERREKRSADLINLDKRVDSSIQDAAIKRARELDTTVVGKYSIWRKEYENPNSDSNVKLMRDQIIMAKAYAMIAKAKNETALYDSLMKHSLENQLAIGEATIDAELHPSVFEVAKAMGQILAAAKDQMYDCVSIARKLRIMLQSSENNLNALKARSSFLVQLAAKTIPRPLHCLPLVLTADFHLRNFGERDYPNKQKLEDPSLYHYAIFSDNILATSVVVNSTIQHAKDPERHVFHIVTDKLNFAAMRMWFLVNSPVGATLQVQKVEDFTWLNSSYCPVLRQLESARMIEYYFKAHQSSTVNPSSDNLKYRNPKYLSVLNHLRFYLPEVYPMLDKILFLDDDIVVQKDLTPLWSVNLHGMVNGAVHTCKESFHRFDKYLNFSNPKISDNFNPNACGWAYGMNMFDLREWKKHNITGIYHHWQELNVDRTLWKLGTLPPGLITFYNLTHPLDRSWHVLGLGYDPALNQTEIEKGAVVHYNGNYKPWLDLAITKYKSYWSKYVQFDNFYIKLCGLTD